MADALLNGNYEEACLFTVYTTDNIPKESASMSEESVDAQALKILCTVSISPSNRSDFYGDDATVSHSDLAGRKVTAGVRWLDAAS